MGLERACYRAYASAMRAGDFSELVYRYSAQLGWAMLLSSFFPGSVKSSRGLGKDSEHSQKGRAEETLIAIKEFKRYLEGVEKELSRLSKKFHNKEIAQGVGFAATGIHEALTYLGIVKKVIEKTERIIAKNNTVSRNEGGLEESNSGERTSLSGAL